MNCALTRQFRELSGWLVNEALPLWFERGLDRRNGGYVEKLSSAGHVMDEPRRARVSGRQIYVFAVAKQHGWHADAAEAVRHGLDWLLCNHLRAPGTVLPLIGADRCVLSDRFDLYDQAFVLFGLAAAKEAQIEAELAETWARGIYRAMAEGWKHPVAGFEESSPRSLPLKANPHMHMLEACLAWEQCSGAEFWSAQADEIAALCLENFLCARTGALREYFDGDWRRLETFPEDVVEPGHQSEWAWLLLRWGQSRNSEEAVGRALNLLDIAERHGRDCKHNLLVNELDGDLRVRDPRMRLWPQTERLKALAACASNTGSPQRRSEIDEQLAGAISGLMRFFDHPVRGAWWEHIGPDGRAIDEPARASSLYHITCAVAELHRYMLQAQLVED